jgi:adenine-specific DNA methylase
MNKLYSSAPLPFQGQKRYWITQLLKVLKENYNEEYTFVDLFGGSGLLANAVKYQYPAAKVIYNDFDNYSERLKNIETTNSLLKKI